MALLVNKKELLEDASVEERYNSLLLNSKDTVKNYFRIINQLAVDGIDIKDFSERNIAMTGRWLLENAKGFAPKSLDTYLTPLTTILDTTR